MIKSNRTIDMANRYDVFPVEGENPSRKDDFGSRDISRVAADIAAVYTKVAETSGEVINTFIIPPNTNYYGPAHVMLVAEYRDKNESYIYQPPPGQTDLR